MHNSRCICTSTCVYLLPLISAACKYSLLPHILFRCTYGIPFQVYDALQVNCSKCIPYFVKENIRFMKENLFVQVVVAGKSSVVRNVVFLYVNRG